MARKKDKTNVPPTDERAAIEAAERAVDEELSALEDTRDMTDEIDAAARLLDEHGLGGDIIDEHHHHHHHYTDITVDYHEHANPDYIQRTRNLALAAFLVSLMALLVAAIQHPIIANLIP